MNIDFLLGMFCGFLIGLMVGAGRVIYQIIWVEKWSPPKTK